MTLTLDLPPELEQHLVQKARQQGQATANDKTIDGDMILVAQAATLNLSDVVIATTNVGHLSRFVAADVWQDMPTF